MNNLPTSPIVLLSYINTKLRDQYSSLESLLDDLNITKDEVDNILNGIGYFYDQNLNKYL